MADALVVLNAGSSSLKFSFYASDNEALALEANGQIEGLFIELLIARLQKCMQHDSCTDLGPILFVS